jgi:hypothetical protein
MVHPPAPRVASLKLVVPGADAEGGDYEGGGMTDTQTEQVQTVWINGREFVALRKGNVPPPPGGHPWPALTEADRVRVFELQDGICSEHGCENQLAAEPGDENYPCRAALPNGAGLICGPCMEDYRKDFSV